MELKTVCTIVLDPDDTHMIDTVSITLERMGFSVENINSAEGVIEACGNARAVQDLKDHHIYGYIRSICTFVSGDAPSEQAEQEDV